MIALWWFLITLHLVLLQGWLGSVGLPWLDSGAVLALFLALYARPGLLPMLLIIAATTRSVLLDGGPALHVLGLGIPVAFLLPLRGVFFRRQILWQCAAAAFLIWTLPRATVVIGALVRRPVETGGISGWHWLPAIVLVPVFVAALLKLPPLRAGAEGLE